MRAFINIIEATGYHGSRRDFDNFDGEFVGTGEGDLRHGWGIYLASSEKIAQQYRRRGEGKVFEVDMPNEDELLTWEQSFTSQSPLVQTALMKMNYPMLRKKAEADRGSEVQPGDFRHDTGQEIYDLLSTLGEINWKSDNAIVDFKKKTSFRLVQGGIAGVKYIDRIDPRAGYSFVIFDPSRVQIKRKA